MAVITRRFQYSHNPCRNCIFACDAQLIASFTLVARRLDKLKDYKKSHPGTEERQREGRARLWDKPQDPELLEGFRAARVPQKPYVYQAD